jgi:hypothetical protein
MKLTGSWQPTKHGSVFESKSLEMRVHTLGIIMDLSSGKKIMLEYSDLLRSKTKIQGGNKRRGIMLLAESKEFKTLMQK